MKKSNDFYDIKTNEKYFFIVLLHERIYFLFNGKIY